MAKTYFWQVAGYDPTICRQFVRTFSFKEIAQLNLTICKERGCTDLVLKRFTQRKEINER
jgi:hypothetical protein